MLSTGRLQEIQVGNEELLWQSDYQRDHAESEAVARRRLYGEAKLTTFDKRVLEARDRRQQDRPFVDRVMDWLDGR